MTLKNYEFWKSHTAPHRTADHFEKSRTAPHRKLFQKLRTAPHRSQNLLHRTAPHRSSHRTANIPDKHIAEILQEINANDARQFLIIFNGVQRIYSRITSFYSH